MIKKNMRSRAEWRGEERAERAERAERVPLSLFLFLLFFEKGSCEISIRYLCKVACMRITYGFIYLILPM